MLILIALILLAWLAVQTTPVQNWLVGKVTNKLSKSLGTTITIKHVDFSLFNKMLLEGTLVHDQHKDTLLYAGVVKINITDWFFFKDKISLNYIGLEDASIHLQRMDSVWNYHFIVDFFKSPKKSTDTQAIELSIKEVDLSNIYLLQKDGWRGEDLSLRLGQLNLLADKFDFANKEVRITSISVDKPSFLVYDYTGNRPDSLRPKGTDVPFAKDPSKLRWNPSGWNIVADRVIINEGSFRSDRETKRDIYKSFDAAHIHFADINGQFVNLRLQKDSLRADITLSTKERSGFEVKKLKTSLLMHPEAMEFSKLDLQTGKSHIHNFFAMRYNSLEDMQSFVSHVTMDANFNDARLHSDDIAFFAPELKDWRREIRITGKGKGTVENLHAKGLVLEAGKDTYLRGNIGLKGLPDINKTYIDFEANDFRTSYQDAITLIPALRDITQPRLDLLKFMRFKGNFTGFISDFVTFGTIQTNLGTVVSDVNMKFPEHGPTVYSGNIKKWI